MPRQDDFKPTAQRDVTRTRVIEGAIGLLARDGYAGASWRQIAEEAGVSTGVLQYHFGDKRTLLEAVVTHLSEEHAESLRRAVFVEGASVPQRVRAFVELAYELMSGSRQTALLDLLVGLRGEAETPVSPEAFDAMEAMHAALWRELFPDTGLAADRLVAAEHLLFAAIHGFSIQRLMDPGRTFDAELEALGDAVTSLLT